MDFFQDPKVKLEYEKSKIIVKRWESEFMKKNGTYPSKDDIKAASSQVKEAYKLYWRLKIKSLGNLEETFDDVEENVKDMEKTESAEDFDDVGENIKDMEKKESAEEESVVDSRIKPDEVWGAHLNVKKESVSQPKKTLLPRSSSLKLSEKLFVGSKFKKRNPRKSISFTHNRNGSKEEFAVPNMVSLTYPESSQQSETDDGFPVAMLDQELDSDILSANNFKITKSSSSHSQPLNPVQRLIDGNSKDLKLQISHELDKGWLNRISKANESEPILLQPSIIRADGNSEKSENENNSVINSDNSDDDFIYDSDPESKNDSGRIKLTEVKSTCNTIVQPYKAKSTENVSDAHENDKKRKPDAIESAMAELSKRRKYKDSFVSPKKVNNKDAIQKKKGNSKEDLLEKKVASGSINDNFIKVNIQKKVFVRGKKSMNFQKYKKQQWRNRKKELAKQNGDKEAFLSRMDPSDGLAGGGLQKCFNCGDVGHFARSCLKMKGDSLLPNDFDEDESPFPTLAEVENMAKEKRDSVHMPWNKISLSNQEKIPQSNAQQDHLLNKDGYSLRSSQRSKSGNAATNDSDICEGEYSKLISSLGDDNLDEIEAIKSESQEPLYPLQENGSLIETPKEVLKCLQKFGHSEFRPGQEEAIMRILSGLTTLLTLSTGSGKSLCYQLPAYLYAQHRKCITLVVSPLVSLMDDQVSGLPPFLHAAALHTSQTPKQQEKIIEMIRTGKLHFLLLSPEAVVSGKKIGFNSIWKLLPNIAFACIDEVHCISQWSHNFRPSYLMVCKVLREKLGIKTILGLTATATKGTVESIVDYLMVPDKLQGVIKDAPLPSNLLLSVSKDKRRDQALVQLLHMPPFSTFESIIIYCTRREECERIAGLLRTYFTDTSKIDNKRKKYKISSECEFYHAAMSSSRRKQVQDAFMSGLLRIVVATVAFGMGINKADVRAVIHFNMPHNFERYVQEVGRAGRDGNVSHCHLFLTEEVKEKNELRRHIYADSVDRYTIRKLLDRVFVPCKCKENARKNLTESNNRTKEKDTSHEQNISNETKEEDKLQTYVVENSDIRCKGHEIAFGVNETVEALDLPEENITTLLCYLELHPRQLIKTLSKGNIVCKVQSYKGMKHILSVARTCTPLGMAVAMELKNGVSLDKIDTLEFAVVEIAAAINWDSGIVKRELKNLEWTKVNDKPCRSGILVTFCELGFRVCAPGDLSPEELEETLVFMCERAEKQERRALSQLEELYSSLSKISFSDICLLKESDDLSKRSDTLKCLVRNYFNQEDMILESYKHEAKLENGDQIANDTRQLVNIYKDCTFTGRSVARIFHGISSPNFPAQVWGRCRFWRLHLNSDFKLICGNATEILRQMK